jgi:hypothetical protein
MALRMESMRCKIQSAQSSRAVFHVVSTADQ